MILAPLPIAALILAASAAVAPALADQPPRKTELPGVVQPEPIVKPLTEPLEQPRKDGNGFVRMGDWDVRISGSVRVDIRTGTFNNWSR